MEKFFKRWEYHTTWPASWEICMQVRKQQLELDMEQQTGSKSGKEYIKAMYCHPAYLTSVQSTSCEMLGWMNLKLESRLPLIWRWHHPYVRKWRRTKEPLNESERVEWKSKHKTQHSKNQDDGFWFHHFMANRQVNNGQSETIFFGSKITADGDCSHEIKSLLEEKLWPK